MLLSIVMPTLNVAHCLDRACAAISHAEGGALATEIIIADGGSTDGTRRLAQDLGAHVVDAPRGRGSQLAVGAAAARGEAFLFLHADTILSPGWASEVAVFLAEPRNRERAGYYRFALDEDRAAARRIERAVAWRCRLFGLPFGDQGLVVRREFYLALGGFRALPLMEDVDIIRRIGRGRLVPLESTALTSADRYRRDGFVLRPLRNFLCLSLYLVGVSPTRIARLYR